MADTKISALTDGTTPSGTDEFVVARGGSNVKLSWTELLAAVGGGGSQGTEIGYDEITTSVTVTSTTEASGTTIISCAAHTFDGAPVLCTFFTPILASGSNTFTVVSLFEASTQIGELVQTDASSGTTSSGAMGMLRFTPTAGSHTYTVTAYRGSSNGTVFAGAGGTATFVPAFIRFTKV